MRSETGGMAKPEISTGTLNHQGSGLDVVAKAEAVTLKSTQSTPFMVGSKGRKTAAGSRLTIATGAFL